MRESSAIVDVVEPLEVFDEQEPGPPPKHATTYSSTAAVISSLSLRPSAANRLVAGARRETEDRREQRHGRLRIACRVRRARGAAAGAAHRRPCRCRCRTALRADLHGMEAGPGVERRAGRARPPLPPSARRRPRCAAARRDLPMPGSPRISTESVVSAAPAVGSQPSGAQHCELARPTDERRREAMVRRFCSLGDHGERSERLGDALHALRGAFGHVETVADHAAHFFGDHDGSRGGQPFDARCEVRGEAVDVVLFGVDEHEAAVDARRERRAPRRTRRSACSESCRMARQSSSPACTARRVSSSCAVG